MQPSAINPTLKGSSNAMDGVKIRPIMAQTLTRLLVHVIFSTKHRSDLIVPEIEPQLYPYMATIGRTNQSPVLAIGGTTNHVHLLVSQSKNIALSDLVMVIKKDSSK